MRASIATYFHALCKRNPLWSKLFASKPALPGQGMPK
jgi:hypothetical protein